MVKFLSSDQIVKNLSKKLKKDISKLKEKRIIPTLAIIFVDKDPQSLIFLKQKKKMAERLGIKLKIENLKLKIKQDAIVKIIQRLNKDPDVQGIIVQLPLPSHLDPDLILNKIAPKKDIDCLSHSLYQPPTPYAILKLLKYYKIKLFNKKITIVGKGRLVGKPLYNLLKKEKANIVACDKKTKDLKSKIKNADILISATGSKNLIKKDMVKKAAVVLDTTFGVEREVEKIASYITPKKGGIGPLTILFLFSNLIEAAKRA